LSCLGISRIYCISYPKFSLENITPFIKSEVSVAPSTNNDSDSAANFPSILTRGSIGLTCVIGMILLGLA